MTLKVLVVEDDREIRALMQSTLSVEGFEVTTAVSLSEAQAVLRHDPPDVLVLDLGLPDGDGAQLVRELRRTSAMPILIVSARHQEAQKIALLDEGADDYLTKPFSVGELLARMRVALRHRGTALAAAQTQHALDDLRVDLEAHRVERDGQPVHLTPTEFKLLGRGVHRAHALPAAVHGAAAGQDRARPRRAAAPAHRDRRGLPARRRMSALMRS